MGSLGGCGSTPWKSFQKPRRSFTSVITCSRRQLTSTLLNEHERSRYSLISFDMIAYLGLASAGVWETRGGFQVDWTSLAIGDDHRSKNNSTTAPSASAVADVEADYPDYSAPANILVMWAAAYHNMAYVATNPTDSNKWNAKARQLFESLASEATTASAWHHADRLAPDGNQREECLRTALVLDPDYTDARRDMLRLFLGSQRWEEARLEWASLRASSGFTWQADGTSAIRLANALAGSGNVAGAQVIIRDEINGSQNMHSIDRCHLFSSLSVDRLRLDTGTVFEIHKIRTVCTVMGHRNRGVAALLKGDKAQAITELELQIQDNPQYAESYLLLEDVLRTSGETDRALAVIKMLFRSGMTTAETCALSARIPLDTYTKMDATFVAQVQTECQK